MIRSFSPLPSGAGSALVHGNRAAFLGTPRHWEILSAWIWEYQRKSGLNQKLKRLVCCHLL